MVVLNQPLLLCSTIYVLVAIQSVNGWDLSGLEHRGYYYNNYAIEHVSIYYVRAFLCLKTNFTASRIQPSLIESTWPENFLPIKPRIFPNDLAHSKTDCDCNGILHAINTATDRHGYLWLIDNGSQYCHPKLIIYNLLKRNEEIHRHIFTEYVGGTFHSIQLFSAPSNTNPTETISYGIICLRRANYLLLYSLQHRKYTKVAFNILVVIPHQILTHHDNELLIMDTANRLWMGDLNRLKSHRQCKKCKMLTITQLGSLLGHTDTLAVTSTLNAGLYNDYLYYYLPRDGAIVRWNFRRPLTAEGHDVLYLTSIPVIQVVFGAKGSVWVVQERQNVLGDHCTRIFTAHPAPNPIF